MLFNSLEFLLFFPLVCIVYFAIPSNRWRNLFLLAASYYFYMCWEPVYALLLFSSTLITYLAAIAMERWRNQRKLFLYVSATANLGILFFFKYFNWAAENVSTFMRLAGVTIDVPEFDVLLPVGISFYIFQALGYSIDVYRNDVKCERNFFTYALFVSFFPQLVAGPIERSTNLLQQFKQKHAFDGDQAIRGIQTMLWGFFLKLVVADRLAVYVDEVFNDMAEQTGGGVLLASCLFCFQLYGDFAGYSYIAIGASRVMGFRLMDNFVRPYFFSTSIQEYWKRNHISLTTWFMDYVYYPLVGSSVSLAWWCFCIFFTFFLSGFWHGAGWTYVVCFSIFGFYLVICLLKEKWQRRFEKRHHLRNNLWWVWLNRLLTFLLVMIALVFFRANNISDAFHAIALMVTDPLNALFRTAMEEIKLIRIVGLLFVVECILEYKKTAFVERHFLLSNIFISLVLLFLIFMMGKFEGGQFIYFQF